MIGGHQKKNSQKNCLEKILTPVTLPHKILTTDYFENILISKGSRDGRDSNDIINTV